MKRRDFLKYSAGSLAVLALPATADKLIEDTRPIKHFEQYIKVFNSQWKEDNTLLTIYEDDVEVYYVYNKDEGFFEFDGVDSESLEKYRIGYKHSPSRDVTRLLEIGRRCSFSMTQV